VPRSGLARRDDLHLLVVGPSESDDDSDAADPDEDTRAP